MPARLPKMTIREYLESRCEWEGECFVFQGSRPKGYGIFMIPGTRKMATAHKAMYEERKGKVAKGYEVMHSCDNPGCCNIKHLSLGTPRDNTQDAIKKNRRGWGGMKPKLGVEDHKKIKELNKSGKNRLEIANSMNVCVDTVARVLNGKTKIRKPGEVARLAAEARWGKKKAK
jgi:hypothetical protein